MINIIKQFALSEKIITIIFSLLLVTLPFGAKIFAFSIGFMTLYPFLLILLLLSFFGLFHLNRIKSKIERYTLILLLTWFFYAFIFYFFIEGKHDAIIDIRSITLMGLTTFVFIWVKNFLGIKKWMSALSFLFKLVYFLLVIVSFLEIKTGIHFAGNFTEKISSLPISSLYYTPIFLYDNPNTLSGYVILLGILVILTNIKSSKNLYFIWLVIGLNAFISHISAARLGELSSYIFIIWFTVISLTRVIKKEYWEKNIFKIKLSFLSISFLFICILFLPKYFGPIWQFDYEPEEKWVTANPILKEVNESSYIIKLDEAKYMNKDTLEDRFSSVKIRTGLLLNGLNMLENSNYLGVGPGQNRFLHTKKQVVYYTKTNRSPHFWLIEILSQYGILIFLGYVGLLIFVFIAALRFLQKDFYLSSLIIISLLIFLIASLLPSSFLILDINWVFIAVIIGITTSLPEIANEVK